MSEYDAKKEKFFDPLDQKDWQGPCLWWHGCANPKPPKTINWQRDRHDPCLWWHGRASEGLPKTCARPVPRGGTAVREPMPLYLQKKFPFLPHSLNTTLSSLKLLSKNSINPQHSNLHNPTKHNNF